MKAQASFLTQPVRSEHEEQAAVVAWADLVKVQVPELALLFAIPNGAPMQQLAGIDPVTGKKIWKQNHAGTKKMKAEGLKKGAPDLVLPVARHGYHSLAIEMKKLNGRVSPEQVWWLDKLSAQGWLATACFGAQDATETICAYLGIQNPVTFW